jgi:hypothetical protein
MRVSMRHARNTDDADAMAASLKSLPDALREGTELRGIVHDGGKIPAEYLGALRGIARAEAVRGEAQCLPGYLGMVATYLVALCAMAFSALSALTLISFLSKLDPPEASTAERREQIAA